MAKIDIAGHLNLASGQPIIAHNSDDYVEGGGNNKALMFERIQLNDGVTLQQLVDGLGEANRQDGRDHILLELTPTGSSNTNTNSNSTPTLALISADELADLEELMVGQTLTVNGMAASIIAINDETDSSGFMTIGKLVLGAVLVGVGQVAGKVPHPVTLLAGLGLSTGGTWMMVDAGAELEKSDLRTKPSNVLSGLASPVGGVKLGGL